MIVLLQILFCLLAVLYLFKNREELTLLSLGLLAGKIVSAIIFVEIYYSYYKEGDLLTYHELADSLTSLVNTEKLSIGSVLIQGQGFPIGWFKQPRAVFFAKIVFVVYNLSFCNIYLTSVLFSFFSWIGLLELNKRLKTSGVFGSEVLMWTYLLVPSVLFWTSGVSKETVCFPFFLLMILFIRNWFHGEFKTIEIIIALCSLCLFMQMRFFYLPFLVLFAFAYGVQIYFKKVYFWIGFGVVICSYLMFQSMLIPQLQISYFSELIFRSYNLFVSRGQSSFELPLHKPDFFHVSLSMLKSTWYVFFLNFNTLFNKFCSIENIAVLCGSVFGLVTFRNKDHLFYSVLFMVIGMVFIINVTTPNFGSLCRYRVVYWYPIGVMVVLKIKGFLESRKPL